MSSWIISGIILGKQPHFTPTCTLICTADLVDPIPTLWSHQFKIGHLRCKLDRGLQLRMWMDIIRRNTRTLITSPHFPHLEIVWWVLIIMARRIMRLIRCWERANTTPILGAMKSMKEVDLRDEYFESKKSEEVKVLGKRAGQLTPPAPIHDST